MTNNSKTPNLRCHQRSFGATGQHGLVYVGPNSPIGVQFIWELENFHQTIGWASGGSSVVLDVTLHVWSLLPFVTQYLPSTVNVLDSVVGTRLLKPSQMITDDNSGDSLFVWLEIPKTVKWTTKITQHVFILLCTAENNVQFMISTAQYDKIFFKCTVSVPCYCSFVLIQVLFVTYRVVMKGRKQKSRP